MLHCKCSLRARWLVDLPKLHPSFLQWGKGFAFAAAAAASPEAFAESPVTAAGKTNAPFARYSAWPGFQQNPWSATSVLTKIEHIEDLWTPSTHSSPDPALQAGYWAFTPAEDHEGLLFQTDIQILLRKAPVGPKPMSLRLMAAMYESLGAGLRYLTFSPYVRPESAGLSTTAGAGHSSCGRSRQLPS